jgi:tRNA threonylcarbamoyladenosine modification (KEOPS) complex Cgi121 subunit
VGSAAVDGEQELSGRTARLEILLRAARVRNVEPAFSRAISTGGTDPLAAP